MGCFTWTLANAPTKKLEYGSNGYILVPEEFKKDYGNVIEHDHYFGYGIFGKYDAYEVVADWNRKFLKENPTFYVHSENCMVKDLKWYPYVSDLTLTKEELNRIFKEKYIAYGEYRTVGIDISTYLEDNERLAYPLKIADNPHVNYEEVGPSDSTQ